MEVLTVLAIFGVVSAMATPMIGNLVTYLKVSGDARNISNAIALVKIRAASNFTKTRLYVDLSGRQHHLEIWVKTTPPGAWVMEGDNVKLSSGVIFGYGSVSNAPPNSQGTIGQAPQCTTAAGVAIGNTACVTFNSRGVPVDAADAPTAADAVYVTDGAAIHGVTVSATGMSRNWRSQTTAGTATWLQQ
jgi:Tfp pilus assembly protein FimT